MYLHQQAAVDGGQRHEIRVKQRPRAGLVGTFASTVWGGECGLRGTSYLQEVAKGTSYLQEVAKEVAKRHIYLDTAQTNTDRWKFGRAVIRRSRRCRAIVCRTYHEREK